MGENWRLTELSFQMLEGLLALRCPFAAAILLRQVRDRNRDLGETVDKLPVKVRKPHEFLCPLLQLMGGGVGFRRLPDLDCLLSTGAHSRTKRHEQTQEVTA